MKFGSHVEIGAKMMKIKINKRMFSYSDQCISEPWNGKQIQDTINKYNN